MESEPTPDANSAAQLLSQAQQLLPAVISEARAALGFPTRWKPIISKLERLPPCLSELSTHPCFARNALCKELLQSATATLAAAHVLAAKCSSADPLRSGKLQTQSDLDALSGELDLLLHDCALLVKTGALGDDTAPSHEDGVRELLARLQIGHAEAKYRAVDRLLEAMSEDERGVLPAIGRSSIAALVRLLGAASAKTREKAATVICALAESGTSEKVLVAEGVLPSLIRLAESGSPICREKAVVSLQRLSMATDNARSVVGHGGVRPLVEICQTGDSISRSAAAGALKNLASVPEVRHALVEQGIVKVMIGLLNGGMVLGAKEYAAECLQNLTASNDGIRRLVVSEGGVSSLLAYLDGPLPQESSVSALRNLIGSVPVHRLVAQGFLPRLVHVLKDGSLGAQQAAAAILCSVSNSADMKRSIGEAGCVALLARMLEAKTSDAREAAAQAMACLLSCCPHNKREFKKDERSIANLVRLLEPTPQNAAKKHAVACLAALSSSKRCKKLMMSYGAVGFLRKLAEADVAGAKKLLERLEKGKLRSLLARK